MDRNELFILVQKVLCHYIDTHLTSALMLICSNVPAPHNFLEVNINGHQQPSLCYDINNMLFSFNTGLRMFLVEL